MPRVGGNIRGRRETVRNSHHPAGIPADWAEYPVLAGGDPAGRSPGRRLDPWWVAPCPDAGSRGVAIGELHAVPVGPDKADLAIG